jgi:hypothetical protein
MEMNDIYDLYFNANNDNTSSRDYYQTVLTKKRRPQRACTLRYPAAYLIGTMSSSTKSHEEKFKVANSATIHNNFTLETQKLFLVNFHSHTQWKDPRPTPTNQPEEVSTIDQCRGGPGALELAIYHNRFDVYIYDHGIPKTLKDAIFKKAKQLKIKPNGENGKFVGQAAAKIRSLLVSYVGRANIPKNIRAYKLCDYLQCVLEVHDAGYPEFPARFVKYLSSAKNFFHAEEENPAERERIASHLAPIFGVPAADIVQAEGIPTFGIEQNQLFGRSIADKVDELTGAIKIETWKYLHRGKGKKITKRANGIDEAYRISKRMWKIYGTVNKLGSKLILDEKCIKVVMANTAYDESSFPSFHRWETIIRENDKFIPMNKPITWKKQLKNSEARMYKKAKIKNTFKPLVLFWQLRKEIFRCAVDTWDDFIWYLSQDDNMVLWVRMIMAAYAVKKLVENTKIKESDASISGKNLTKVLDFALSLRTDMPELARAHFFQKGLLFALMSKWFKLRSTTAVTLNIISLADFDRRQKIVADNNWHDINHVVDFIRTGVGRFDYRVRIAHAKKRQNSGKDIDLSGKDLKKYEGLLDLLPEIFQAYALLTKHAVTHSNRQPIWKVTPRKRAFGKSSAGRVVVIQNHQFPWAFPGYEFGAKHAISPMLDSKFLDCAYVFIKVDPDKLCNGYPSVNGKLSDWGSKNIKEVENWLRSQTCNISVDGKNFITSLKPMPFANAPMVESGSLYCLKNNVSTTTKSIAFFDRFIKRVIKSGGSLQLKAKDFGMDYEFECSAPITEHLKLYAKHCKLQYKYFGRTGSAPQSIFAAEWIIEKLNAGCARAEARLNDIVAKVLQEEDHVSEDICKGHYVTHKSDALKPFAEIYNETHHRIDVREDYRNTTAQRLASGKIRPSMQDIKVSGFVEPRVPFGSLKERCNDVHHLTIKEQDAQASFLAMIERRNQLILQLAADDAIASNNAFQLVKSEVEQEMRKAQHLWDAKNSTGICRRVTNAGKRAWESIGLSPSKRHKT